MVFLALPSLVVITYLLGKRSLRRFGTVLTPECLFVTSITTAVTLYHCGIVEFEPLSLKTWATLAFAIVAFLIGSFLAERLTSPKSCKRKITSTRLITLAAGTTFIGALMAADGLIGATGSLFGFSTAALDFGYFYDLWGGSSGKSLYILNVVATPINTVGLITHWRRKGPRKGVFALFLAINITALAISPVKVNLIRGIFLSLSAATLTTKGSRRLTLAGAVAILMFFVWHTNVRSPYYQNDYGNYQASGMINLPSNLAFLGAPFMYATGGLAALNQYLETNQDRQLDYGRNTFGFLLSAAARIGIDASPPEQNKEFLTVPFRTNVYSGFRSTIDDFAAFGFLIWGIYSFISKSIFLAMFAGKTEWLFAYGILAFCSTMVFFSNHFAYFATLIIFVWSFLCGVFLFRPVARS